MEQLVSLIAVSIAFALIFGLGTWLFTTLTATIAVRLPSRWRWLALLITAAVSFGAFLVLRPLVLDKPMNQFVFIGLLACVALLVSGATALGLAFVDAGRALVALFAPVVWATVLHFVADQFYLIVTVVFLVVSFGVIFWSPEAPPSVWWERCARRPNRSDRGCRLCLLVGSVVVPLVLMLMRAG